MVSGLKFLILVEEGFHYLCLENQGADQLRGYLTADLRLNCNIIMQKAGFLINQPLCEICESEYDRSCWVIIEPRYEKTGLRGFSPGPTQTGLYSH